MKNIFNISITKDDHTYYKKNESSFDVRNYRSFIEREAPLCKIQAVLDKDVEKLDGYREAIAKFYEYSFKRDEAFVRNVRVGKSVIASPEGAKQSLKGIARLAAKPLASVASLPRNDNLQIKGEYAFKFINYSMHYFYRYMSMPRPRASYLIT